MAPPAKFTVSALDATARDGVGWTPLAGLKRAVPSRFDVVAVVDEPACTVTLDVFLTDGVPVVHELTVTRPGPPWGSPVSAVVLRRLAVAELLRRGVEAVARPLVVREDVEGHEGHFVYQVPADDDEPSGDVTAFVGPVARPLTGTGRRTSDATLRQVADVYRSVPRASSQAVADQLNISRSHAARLVQKAREAGHLGHTTPGKAGEQS